MIETYFTAADLAVFPYRGLIGASASMAMAIKYGMPFVASDKMHEVFESQDMKEALAEAGISQKQLLFAHSVRGIASLVKSAQDETYRSSLMRFTKAIAAKRNSEYIVRSCYNKLYSHSQNTQNHGKSFPYTLAFPKHTNF
jgi:hypothetical protein